MIADHMLLLGPGETVRRLPRVVGGLILFGVGITLMIEGDLGLAPWDVFHKGVAEQTGLSIGSVIVITSGAVVLGFLALGEKLGLGTILNAFVIGLVVDLALPLIPTPDAIAGRLAFTFTGPILIAIASGFYIGGGLGPGPRDGLMTGLAKRGIDVWKARTAIEMTVLIIGLFLGGTVGLGTIWFTVGIGPLVQFFLPRLSLPPPPR